MSNKKEILFIPNLWEMDEAGAIEECCNLLKLVPVGSKFYIGHLILELTFATPLELKVMKMALKEEREFGLVKVGNNYQIIPGLYYGVHVTDVNSALKSLDGFRRKSAYMHTHWNKIVSPLPSTDDFIYWQELKYDNPLINCRVAFPHQNKTQVVRFIGTGRNPNIL